MASKMAAIVNQLNSFVICDRISKKKKKKKEEMQQTFDHFTL